MRTDDASILRAADLDLLIQALRRRGYAVKGPTCRDGAIVYDELKSAGDLPIGWTEDQDNGHYRLRRRGDEAYFGYAAGPHAWKRFLQPPWRKVWEASRADGDLVFSPAADEAPPMAFMGVRSCELHALAIQDRVLMEGAYHNPAYAARREQAFIVAVNCTASASTCFCTAMNTGPRINLDHDLAMTEVLDGDAHYFLVSAGSRAGSEILSELPLEEAGEESLAREEAAVEATARRVHEGRRARAMADTDLKALLYRNYDSPQWDEVAQRCLSCANCTMACPTCFCSSVEDVTDLNGDHAERWERWDSCFTGDFSYVHGGSVRQSTRSRYRQWISHKLATWYDQFGTSGCVGCGRCIAWCPVGIDITEEVAALKKREDNE